MRPSRALLLLTLTAALAAGCGDDDEAAEDTAATTAEAGAESNETFEAEGFDISFEYPEDFEELEDVQFSESAGSAASATAAVGLDGTNLLAVQRFDLQQTVTDDNFAKVQQEADQLFSGLAGEKLEGQRLTVAGLPALEYDIDLDEPADAQTRAIAIFDGNAEYLLNCQSTPEQQEAIEAACELALETFQTE